MAHFTGDIEDNGDGTYDVRYYAMVAGIYTMSIVVGSTGLHRDFGFFNVEESLMNSHIVGSPFKVTVTEGTTIASSCVAFGEATIASTWARLTPSPASRGAAEAAAYDSTT